MPRVVPNQKDKFDKDELFRKLSNECDVKFSSHRELLHDERKKKFKESLNEGLSSISFMSTGTNLSLQFYPGYWVEGKTENTGASDFVDFNKEIGKVHIKSEIIFNGVCVDWVGWIDLETLVGKAKFVYNCQRAAEEEQLRRSTMDQVKQRKVEFEKKYQAWNDQQHYQLVAAEHQTTPMSIPPVTTSSWLTSPDPSGTLSLIQQGMPAIISLDSSNVSQSIPNI